MSGTTATHSDNERLTRNDILRKFKKKTPMQEIMIRFLRNRMAVVGIIIFAAILLLAIFADVIADYETVALKMNIPERLQAPSAAHWLGTDDSGRDVFARIIHGARTSLWIGFVATAFSLLLGGALGAIAGYVGGWLDELIMRIMDVMLCLPEMLLASPERSSPSASPASPASPGLSAPRCSPCGGWSMWRPPGPSVPATGPSSPGTSCSTAWGPSSSRSP